MHCGSVLIFHAGALGDFVLTWFIARGLAKIDADREIAYVTHTEKGRLATRFLGTSASSLDTDGWHTLFSEVSSLHLPARQLLDRVTTAICFIADGNDLFTRNLRGLAPGLDVCHIRPLPPADYAQHVTSYYVDQLTIQPVVAFEQAIADLAIAGIPVPPGTRSRLLLHPGAGSVRKCWPLENYVELAEELRERGHEPTLLLGEVEQERLPDRVREELAGRFKIIAPANYLSLAEELLDARLLVTNDNGPAHLAAALGAKVLSIFGPTDPKVWRPIGPGAQILHRDPLTSLSPSAVLQKALDMLQAR